MVQRYDFFFNAQSWDRDNSPEQGERRLGERGFGDDMVLDHLHERIRLELAADTDKIVVGLAGGIVDSEACAGLERIFLAGIVEEHVVESRDAVEPAGDDGAHVVAGNLVDVLSAPFLEMVGDPGPFHVVIRRMNLFPTVFEFGERRYASGGNIVGEAVDLALGREHAAYINPFAFTGGIGGTQDGAQFPVGGDMAVAKAVND